MKINVAISTCPNDTFIFDALLNKRIDIGAFQFDLLLSDIQDLNDLACKGEVDLVKISYAAYPLISSKYQLLTSGSALGRGVGPLVISKRKIYPDEISLARIAIPGEHTTANLLFSMAFPEAKQKKSYLFSDLEDVILSEEADVGVIIHENRFTYQLKGLKEVLDLGNFWEEQTDLPVPLGGIAIRRDLNNNVKLALDGLVKRSVEYAVSHPNQSYPFVRKHAQTMNEEVMRKHIDLYVNDFSIDLGDIGRKAVLVLLGKSLDENKLVDPIFVR